MQQQTPPQGRLFPDPPQEQRPAAPRFAPSATQPYEPQPRMQQTGSFPVYSSARYTTGSLQTLHTQPVQTMPPMATMPTAQNYQASMHQEQPQPVSQGTPMIVQTVQGTPVLVTLEQLQAALKAQNEPEKEEKATGKRSKARKEKKREKKPFSFKLSVTWFIFGLIGMGTTAVFVLRLVITLLLKLKGQL